MERFKEIFPETNRPLVSIIVPQYGNHDLTNLCLETLVAMLDDRSQVEIIVVDDASPAIMTPAELEVLTRPMVADRIISLSERSGFAKACNAGLAVAHGAYVVFLNNDCQSFRPWVWDIIAPLQERPGVGMVGALLLYPGRTPRRVQHAGMAFASKSMSLHRFRGKSEDGHGGILRARALQAVTAACMAMRTEELRALGGFCEDYKNGFEDLDLCFRVRFNLGKLVWYEPEVCLTHIESATPGRFEHEDSNGQLFVSRWGDKVIVDSRQLDEADARADEGGGV